MDNAKETDDLLMNELVEALEKDDPKEIETALRKCEEARKNGGEAGTGSSEANR